MHYFNKLSQYTRKKYVKNVCPITGFLRMGFQKEIQHRHLAICKIHEMLKNYVNPAFKTNISKFLVEIGNC
jgi:hypothetical protein